MSATKLILTWSTFFFFNLVNLCIFSFAHLPQLLDLQFRDGVSPAIHVADTQHTAWSELGTE